MGPKAKRGRTLEASPPPPGPRHFLLKTEPDAFSLDDLRRAPEQRTSWEGVRNFAARNVLREMRLGVRAGERRATAVLPAVGPRLLLPLQRKAVGNCGRRERRQGGLS